MTTNTDRLEAEIRAARNSLMNAIIARRDHPTFGYTKARIRSEYDRLLGMTTAWAYVTGVWTHPAGIVWTHEFTDAVERQLGVDLVELRTATESA